MSTQKIIDNFSEDEKDRLVRMGWEDRTPFEAIEHQFGLNQNAFIQFMRSHLTPRSFQRWRKRAGSRGHLKQGQKRELKVMRFKCSRQNMDGSTKGWK